MLFKRARLVDPKNKINKITDLAIKSGRIEKVKSEIDSNKASKVFNLSGKVVVPGIIDPHVHLSNWIGGSAGYRMMAKVGVITAVDFAGPLKDIINSINEEGAGLNIAVLEAFRLGINLPSNNPSFEEIEKFVQRAVNQGAIGVKILGGHYPLTPEATAKIIEIANKEKTYVAYHIGTTATRSDLNGFKEAIDLVGDKGVHIAHINSYCRGLTGEPLDELKEVFSLLEEKNNIVSASYLSSINGTSGKCIKGKPESSITNNCLRMGQYPPTELGLCQAIKNGFAQVSINVNKENILLTGLKGVKYWQEADTDITICFPVNLPQIQFLCATSKDKYGKFLVNALCTDGGGIPRNVTIEKGLLLVKFGAMSLEEFVIKSSLMPAQMFGMINKGHLGEGADADITVLDLEEGKAIIGINKGKIIMVEGVVIGEKGRILTTKHGEKNIRKVNTDYELI
ncbi:MAG: amidohydrolase family protein, partial [Caldisericota bacterium]|nr:amidohydrolase family protein [Caldisericota bacterium]